MHILKVNAYRIVCQADVGTLNIKFSINHCMILIFLTFFFKTSAISSNFCKIDLKIYILVINILKLFAVKFHGGTQF